MNPANLDKFPGLLTFPSSESTREGGLPQWRCQHQPGFKIGAAGQMGKNSARLETFRGDPVPPPFSPAKPEKTLMFEANPLYPGGIRSVISRITGERSGTKKIGLYPIGGYRNNASALGKEAELRRYFFHE